MEFLLLFMVFLSSVECYPKNTFRTKRDLFDDVILAEKLTNQINRYDYEDNKKDQYHNFEVKKRIVDGTKARKGGFPWQIGIYFEGKLICGGTLISKRYVITAAHCLDDLKKGRSKLKQYEVHLGEYDRNILDGDVEIRRLHSYLIHEEYQKGDIHANDIAIIELDRNAALSIRIFPACIPNKDDQLHAGDKCVLTGWGREYAWGETEKILNELTTPVVEHKECKEKNEVNDLKITESMLCTGSKSSFAGGCMGDSGGPLSCIQRGTRKWKVYGVVSWGSVQCNGLDKYTVYTKVIKFLNWIKVNTGVVSGENCYREDP